MLTRTQSSIGSLLGMLLVLLASGPGAAQAQAPRPKAPAAAGGPRPGGKPATGDKAAANGDEAVRQAITAYGRAVSQGDLAAMAKFWTADGDYVGPRGRAAKARQALEKGSASDEHPLLVLETESLRMITPDVALEDGVCQFAPAGEKPIFRGRYSAVWVKQQGAWLLSSLRENVPPPAAHGDRMAALEWLVGEWEASHEGSTITVTSHWANQKMYLVREIVVERDERVVHRVSQRLAWDPLTRRLKGWTFDADGGLGESIWTKQGDTWVVQSDGVTRDGQATSAKNIYSDITPDSFVLRSLEAQTGKESRPEFELHFKRLPADE